jgi:hypothetical protein
MSFLINDRQKDGKQIFNNDKRRKIVGSKLIIENATSAVDAGDYMCRIDALTASGGAQFGQIIQLRGIQTIIRFRNL